MQSIWMLIIYVVICGSISVLYFSGVLDRLGIVEKIIELWDGLCPEACRCDQNARLPVWVNKLLVVLYHAVVLGSHIVAILDVLPYADQKLSSSTFNHVAIMYHMWIVHSLFYLLCIFTDPGKITRENAKKALEIYQYDGEMYKQEKKCSTCQVIKPARSKHCSACNVCIFRFDHHCIWINCCIGGFNHKFFVCLLLSAIAMTVNGMFLCYYSVLTIYKVRKLSAFRYIGPDGSPTQLQGIVLVQEYPRMFLLAFSLVLLTILLSVFTCHHLILIGRNQTTNELYKSEAMPDQIRLESRQFYNKGMWQNLKEILFSYDLS